MAIIERRHRRLSVLEWTSDAEHSLRDIDHHPPIRPQAPLDDIDTGPRSFLVNVPYTLEKLVAREDTIGDQHITIDDNGPKTFSLGGFDSDGYRRYVIRGTYRLSNLLEELTIAKEKGFSVVTLEAPRLCEDPVDRLQRKIKDVFWPSLIRRLDAEVIDQATQDTKVPDPTKGKRIYVPSHAKTHLSYYGDIARQRPELKLQVIPLSLPIAPETYYKLVKEPGLLALDTEDVIDEATGTVTTRAVPFMVPGGRFNEFFGWDSYFIGLGLFLDCKYDLIRGIIQNWSFEIQNYGIIPNANRSYLFMRSQPPFLTDLSVRLYKATHEWPDAKSFLKRGIESAIKEYHGVWLNKDRLDAATGLSKYHPGGSGVPMECEPGHFDDVLRPYAVKHNMSIDEFTVEYNENRIQEPELDEYLLNDRGVRESGHDTSSRLEGRAARLAIMDLNFCLYKYEKDIAWAIKTVFEDDFTVSPEFTLPSSLEDSSSSTWENRANARKIAVDKYLWNEQEGIYFDYDVRTHQQISSESPTCLWALWCGIASDHQAQLLVSKSLHKFEYLGGIAASSRATKDAALKKKDYQWDYPYGWAPHQMLAWDGLSRYGYKVEASRLAYRWLCTIIKVFVDYNGAVTEKYNVTRSRDPHKVAAEYGNQGTQFRGYAAEGFGWTNASFVCGLAYLNPYMRKTLSFCAPYESLAQLAQGVAPVSLNG